LIRSYVLALLGLAVASSGCAGFRAGTVPETTPWPPARSATTRSVNLVVTAAVSVNQKPRDVLPGFVSRWQGITQRTYAESGLFSAVLDGSMPADLRAEVRITNDGELIHLWSFVSGWTLGLVPSRSIDRFTMRTEFKNDTGDVLATIEKSDTVSTWIQLFLVFAMPFKLPGPVADDLLADLSRATLAEARARGLI
jgi:hypothetical protein